MSDFHVADLHDSLPHEAQLALDFYNNVVQQDETMLLDAQPPVDRPPELLDHSVQQYSFFDNAMLLDHQLPLEPPPEHLGYGAQQDFMTGTAMPLDCQPSVEQPVELHVGDDVQQDSMFDEFMAIDDHTDQNDQSSVGQPPQLYNYGTTDFDGADFERDMAHIEDDAPGWWVRYGGSLHSNGTIDFGSSIYEPDFDFDLEMGGTSDFIDPTAHALPADPINPFGHVGLPATLDTTPTSGQSQQVLAQPDPGPSQYPLPPVSQHPLPYNFDWDDIAERQSRVAAGNRHFITNSGTGTVLEAIPENEAQSPGMIFSPPKRPSTIDNLNSAAMTLTTPSPSPTMQAATIKRQPGERRHTIATGRNQPAVKFPIYSNSLLVTDLADAKSMANTRIALDVIDDDDRDDVALRPHFWVPLIAKAFESDFLLQPDDGTLLTAEGQAEWTRWQSEHENKVWAILHSQPDAPKYVQSCAYIFYELVLEAHEIGKGLPHVGKTIANPGPDITLKCSERVNSAISVLARFPIVRYDFLRQDRLDGLATNPHGFVNRKIENMWVNYKKKPNTGPVKIEPVKAEPADGADAIKGKVNGKKRRASAMDRQVDANGLPTGIVVAVTTQPQRKKSKPAPKKRGSQAMVPSSEVATPMDVKEEDEIT
jgi:hypothetical protein